MPRKMRGRGVKIMEVTKNKIKTDKNGKPVKQEVTWSNAYGSSTGKYERRGNKTILTEVDYSKK